MPYQLAPSWRGQALPPGALGYPVNHPNVYSYARPVYIKGRGFVTLRRGLGQSVSSITSTLGCDAVSIPASQGCSAGDASLALLGFAPSAACQKAINDCIYGNKLTIPAPAPPPAPTLTNQGVGIQTGCNCVAAPDGTVTYQPCPAGTVPSAADYACIAQGVSNAQISQQQQQVKAASTCPAGTYAESDGTCGPCPPGQTQQLDGSCSSLPDWASYALAAVALVILIVAVKQ